MQIRHAAIHNFCWGAR